MGLLALFVLVFLCEHSQTAVYSIEQFFAGQSRAEANPRAAAARAVPQTANGGRAAAPVVAATPATDNSCEATLVDIGGGAAAARRR